MRWASVILLAALNRPAPLPAQTTPLPGDSAGLTQITDLIERYYWRALSHDSLLAALHAGGLAALDPYSALLSRTEWYFFNASLQSSFGGIGARLDRDSLTGQFRFLGTYPGSPAQAAGVRPGDVLLTVDGAPVTGRSLEQGLQALRGSAGSTVTIEVRHAADGIAERVVIHRALIHTATLRGAQHAPKSAWDYHLGSSDSIAYLRLLYFGATTPAELDSALAAIGQGNAKGLILDLRGNPGGLLDAAVQAADLFLDSGVVVSLRGRQPPDEVRRAKPGVSSPIPLAILINGETISAAELFTAALQDQHRALVVGARSFGKGTVQRVFPLPDSSGALKLTIEAYLRPSGRPIERHVAGVDTTLGGVWPDSGMTVPETAEQAAALNARLEQDDGLGFLAETSVRPPSRDNDPALARAYEALLAGLVQ